MKRGKPMSRKPMKKKMRSSAEFNRIYGSKARVVAIHALRCYACHQEPAECVHTASGGMGRKAGWETVADIGRKCHRRLHALGSCEAFKAETGIDLRARAAFLAEFLHPEKLPPTTAKLHVEPPRSA